MERDWERLGAAIKRARKAAEMTQSELAAAVDVSLATIKSVEGGRPYRKAQPTHRAIADLLGWFEGSVEAVLAGGDPVLASAESPPEQVPGRLPEGLSKRTQLALTDEEIRVVDSDVISAGSGDDRGVVMVFTAPETVSREELRRDMLLWAELQRAARLIFSKEPPSSS